MTTTNGLLATPYGSLAHGRFAISARPRIAGAIAARSPVGCPNCGGRRTTALPVARDAGNLLAATTIGRQGCTRSARRARASSRATAPSLPRFRSGRSVFARTQRVLLEAGRPVRIGGRGLDLLVALVERAGELVTKDELVARVWPNVSVSEG